MSMSTSTHVQATCPSCARVLRVRREYLGRRAQCKYCEGMFTIAEDDAKATVTPEGASMYEIPESDRLPAPSSVQAEPDREPHAFSAEVDVMRGELETLRATRFDGAGARPGARRAKPKARAGPGRGPSQGGRRTKPTRSRAGRDPSEGRGGSQPMDHRPGHDPRGGRSGANSHRGAARYPAGRGRSGAGQAFRIARNGS